MTPPVHVRRAASGQSGFTLVELITVVVVLGVLAAVALPRFSELQGNARGSKLQALGGSMKAAAANVKAAALAQAVNCSTPGVTAGVQLERQDIDLNHCYPQAVAGSTGILGAANVDPSRDGVIVSGGGATPGTSLTLQAIGARSPATCQLVYTSPASPDAQATVQAVTDGC